MLSERRRFSAQPECRASEHEDDGHKLDHGNGPLAYEAAVSTVKIKKIKAYSVDEEKRPGQVALVGAAGKPEQQECTEREDDECFVELDGMQAHAKRRSRPESGEPMAIDHSPRCGNGCAVVCPGGQFSEGVDGN